MTSIPAPAAETAARVGGMAIPFDAADPDAVVDGVREVEVNLGQVDVLVANHAYMTMASVLEERPEDRRRMLEVNLLGTAWLIGAVAVGMRARRMGSDRRDRIRVGYHRMAKRLCVRSFERRGRLAGALSGTRSSRRRSSSKCGGAGRH